MKDGTVMDTDIHYVPEDIYPQIKNYIERHFFRKTSIPERVSFFRLKINERR